MRILIGTGAVCTALLFAALPARAGIAKIEGEKCEIKPLSTNEPDWHQVEESLASLMKTGKFDVKGTYRFKACENEFTIYVLQGTKDRSALYECSSDDTYRPVVPCFKLGPAPKPAATR